MHFGGYLLYSLNNIDCKLPVKVVSSMGQQSEGESYSLNHLVDTSFSGSAMRTTGIVAQPMT